jgi:ABC-type molybdate transport system permease subunit
MMKKKLLVFLLTTILLNGMLLFFIGSMGEYGAKMHYALSKNLTKKEVTFQFTPAALKTYLRNKN